MARIEAVADEDSDGDGVANLLELVTGHFPGEADDRPAAAELANGRAVIAELRRNASGYAWNPFERVKRPELPSIRTVGWAKTPIDFFIAAEHEARGLTPRPEAAGNASAPGLSRLDRFPPTPDQLHAFEADESENAYERVVDQLLASPQYGERRWGRHWMDVWRYSDWAGWGKQVRDSQPHIWHWRDWIVESLNCDQPYDRMIVSMLAADEAWPEDANAIRATGYLARNFKLLSREKWMQDTVDHTAQAFLGLTLGCARCHNHMYEPILQKEYYQVRAIFEPYQVRIDRVPGTLDRSQNGLPRVYDAQLDAKTLLFVRGDDRHPTGDPLSPGVPDLLGVPFPEPEPVSLPHAAISPDRRAFVIDDQMSASHAQVAGAASELAELERESNDSEKLELAQDRARMRRSSTYRKIGRRAGDCDDGTGAEGFCRLDEGRSAGDESTTIPCRRACSTRRGGCPVTHRKVAPPGRAEADKAHAQALKALFQAQEALTKPPSTAYNPPASTTYPRQSTGRRLALARWITGRSNPLTARVAVNHLWGRHFGRAIVPSVNDFGRNGQRPSHPALLDWLAAEFMDNGWSMKSIHRLIVTSATYRQDSKPAPSELARDPDNIFLWRWTPRRAEAEVVRDCLFAIAGNLESTMGGPDIDHQAGLTVPRRSLYFRHAAEKQMEFLQIFDAAGVTECYRRKESILPQQALALANSDLSLRRLAVCAHALVRVWLRFTKLRHSCV